MTDGEDPLGVRETDEQPDDERRLRHDAQALPRRARRARRRLCRPVRRDQSGARRRGGAGGAAASTASGAASTATGAGSAASGAGPKPVSFPALHVEAPRQVSPEDWVVTVDGLVDRPLPPRSRRVVRSGPARCDRRLPLRHGLVGGPPALGRRGAADPPRHGGPQGRRHRRQLPRARWRVLGQPAPEPRRRPPRRCSPTPSTSSRLPQEARRPRCGWSCPSSSATRNVKWVGAAGGHRPRCRRLLRARRVLPDGRAGVARLRAGRGGCVGAQPPTVVPPHSSGAMSASVSLNVQRCPKGSSASYWALTVLEVGRLHEDARPVLPPAFAVRGASSTRNSHRVGRLAGTRPGACLSRTSPDDQAPSPKRSCARWCSRMRTPLGEAERLTQPGHRARTSG